jgi:hypothetical protein
MTSTIAPQNDNAKKSENSHPGMMGDGTEEQNLNQPGTPDARIKKDELDKAFGQQPAKK